MNYNNVIDKIIAQKKQLKLTTNGLSLKSGIPVGTLNKILTKKIDFFSIINIANAIIIDKHSYVLIIEPSLPSCNKHKLSAVIGANRSAYSLYLIKV